MRVPTDGVYRIVAKGGVNGYVQPRLTFGATRSVEDRWVFAALSMISVDLAIAAWWFGRRAGTGSINQRRRSWCRSTYRPIIRPDRRGVSGWNG